MCANSGQRRRDVLKGAATAGVISMAGCLSGDSGDKITVTIGGTSQNSSTQAAGQALARAASQHSDTVNVSVQVTDGWIANLQEYDSDNIPAMGVDNNSIAKAMADEGPFADNPVETLPHQGFMFTSLQIHMLGLEDSGLESTADLKEGGYTIYPIQPGFGTRQLTKEILEDAGVWEQNDINKADTSDIPGQVEEGNIDAICMYGANGVELSGWCQEVDVRSGDGLYLLEVDDEFRQAIEDHPGALLEEFEPYGYEQDVTDITDTVTSWSLAAQWAFGPDVPAEATKEIARLSLEHEDTLREADKTTLDFTPEKMTETVMEDLEVHEGVAEFFEENDVWDDAWTRGEAESGE
ncbi:TAXI family TRAP transporter solute-binding subunit [Natrinema amylolyticum]|uniref:TAXI family TRAP transporter solute-binding subunit n=1 Tax=Natrinema amylolyticum TaxID=2878679 RepID=UPI001CFAAD07|nr:TAXI family TRAP transporter solute-binding subunit [Natrinema amylolyticum]